jgi:hypothetical protein
MKETRLTHLRRFAEALRPLTDGGVTMTDEEVVSHWEPNLFPIGYDFEGDHCTCGHEIHYIYEVINRETGVHFKPIGSKCISTVFDVELDAKLNESLMCIYVSLSERMEYKWLCKLPSDFVCKDKGFCKATMDWLSDRLDDREWRYLDTLYRSRDKSPTYTERQAKFQYVIARDILNAIYKEIKHGQ